MKRLDRLEKTAFLFLSAARIAIIAFPELPFFNQLQKHAVEQQSKAAIVDVGAGFERSYAQLVEVSILRLVASKGNPQSVSRIRRSVCCRCSKPRLGGAGLYVEPVFHKANSYCSSLQKPLKMYTAASLPPSRPSHYDLLK